MNSDPVLHNVHAYDPAHTSLFNVSMAVQGVKLQQRLPQGLVRVKCDVHPWMTGFVYASETPYAAVTGKDGAFRLDGVPPGTYTLHVWHEVLGAKDAGVTVPPKGAANVSVALSNHG